MRTRQQGTLLTQSSIFEAAPKVAFEYISLKFINYWPIEFHLEYGENRIMTISSFYFIPDD
jgi:hypothetical protein